MQMVIDYPKLLPDVLQTTRTAFEQEARMAMAVKLFDMEGMRKTLVGLAGVRWAMFCRPAAPDVMS